MDFNQGPESWYYQSTEPVPPFEQDYSTVPCRFMEEILPGQQYLFRKPYDPTEHMTGPFRVMDLPTELRLLIWSQDLPFWTLKMNTKDMAWRSHDSWLLQVSKDVRKEVASLAMLELNLGLIGKDYDPRTSMRKLWVAACAWKYKGPMHPINYLSRLRFKFTTKNLTCFEFNFLLDDENNLRLGECGSRRVDCPRMSVLPDAISAGLQTIVQTLNEHYKEPSTARGIHLFKAIMACEGILQGILKANPFDHNRFVRDTREFHPEPNYDDLRFELGDCVDWILRLGLNSEVLD